MKQVFCVYKTDCHHSYDSFELIGIATSRAYIQKIVSKQAHKENERLSGEDIQQLSDINQTQGYTGEGEFFIQQYEVNILL